MTAGTLLVVHRTGDQILVMLPLESDTDARYYAIVNEDEAYCISSAMRRLALTRDVAAIEAGDVSDKLRVERVNHNEYPFELMFEHEDGTIIVDLRKDEALTFADMLWGAHRSSTFYMNMTLCTVPRRQEARSQAIDWMDAPRREAVARLLGDAHRRVRGEGPKPKN